MTNDALKYMNLEEKVCVGKYLNGKHLYYKYNLHVDDHLHARNVLQLRWLGSVLDKLLFTYECIDNRRTEWRKQKNLSLKM
ncbi:hypothetical protein Trydic_g11401 [Trypoxylus dichotomus]